MVASLRVLAIASVAPAAVGLSQVHVKRAQPEGVTGPSHIKHRERTDSANPMPKDFHPFANLGDTLHTVADRLTHGRDRQHTDDGLMHHPSRAASLEHKDDGLTAGPDQQHTDDGLMHRPSWAASHEVHHKHKDDGLTAGPDQQHTDDGLMHHPSQAASLEAKRKHKDDGLTTGQRSEATVSKTKHSGHRSEATVTKTKRSGSHRLADMKTVKKAAAGVEYTTRRLPIDEHALLEGQTRVHNPIFEEMCRGMDDCKLSVCRWLQLSEEDTGSGPCQLFEQNLGTCRGWTAPESRAEGALAEDIDCAVNQLRTASVGPAGVPEKVVKIESCLEGMGEGSMDNCVVALSLITDSIAEWRKLQAMDVELGEIHAALDEEMPRAMAALKSTEAGQQAKEADVLRPILLRAENISMEEVDQIAGARELLTKLDKIPPVRAQLKAALHRAEESFETHSLTKVRQAIAWLGVALMEGAKAKVDLGPRTNQAKAMMVRLESLNMALQELSRSTQVANVSLQSKTGVWRGLQGLTGAVEMSQAAGLEPEALSEAKVLLLKLRELHSAVADLEVRTREAQRVLSNGGDKGMESLQSTLQRLNHSLLAAEGLGLSDNSSVTGAVGVMDSLAYAYAARKKLDSVLDAAQTILLQDGDELSDAKEEAMIDLLTPAIKWGKDVGFAKGIPDAEGVLAHLRHMRHLKQRMRLALAQGNWSVDSKTGLVAAKSLLSESLLHVDEVTAGKDLAGKLVDSLTVLIEARSKLRKAVAVVNGTIKRNLGYESAAKRLNGSIAEAAELGFDRESDVAAEKLDSLEAFVDAREGLMRAVAIAAPKRAMDFKEAKDNYTHAHFDRQSLEPKDLGALSQFADDKDPNEEYIQALESAVAAAAADGFVDPKQQKALALAKAAKTAASRLKAAIHEGHVALTVKDGIGQAVTTLRAAIIDAEQAGITKNLDGARSVLAKLLPIEPARTELIGAVLQGNTSMKTEQQLAKASVRLHEAIDLNHHLYLNRSLVAAHKMSVRVDNLNEALLDVKAAIISGEEAVKTDVGVSDAIEELSQAVDQAEGVNLTRDVDTAKELLNELTNMQSISSAVEQSLKGPV